MRKTDNPYIGQGEGNEADAWWEGYEACKIDYQAQLNAKLYPEPHAFIPQTEDK